MSVVGRVVQPFLPDVGPPPDPRAPGPFAFADKDYLAGVLDAAGFCDVAIEGLERDLKVGDGVEDALTFQQKIGPLARGLAALEEDERARAMDAARGALEPHVTDQGIWLGAACWLVSAKA